jgi:hypothetical protein
VALTGTGFSATDSTPPDLQLSGPKKQNPQEDELKDLGGRPSRSVRVKASCGDEECTARATGKLTNVKKDKLTPSPGRPSPKVAYGTIDLAPGETKTMGPELKKSQRKQVREALADGKNVQAKVTVRAKDAAGNVATAKRTIKLVKKGRHY